MTTKQFTELTREELIEEIIEMFDPKILQHRSVLGILDAEFEDMENALALKIRNGVYYVAKFEWTYYNLNNPYDLAWEEITREELRQHMYNSLATRSLNDLRLRHQVAKKDKHFIKKDINKSKQIENYYELIMDMQVDIIKRTRHVSDMPEAYTNVGTVGEKLDAAFIEEHNIQSNMKVWSNGDKSLILSIDKEHEYMETLAYKDVSGESYVFVKDESKSGLFATLNELTLLIEE